MILKDKIYFIAGTGTDIGKTYLVERICSKLKRKNFSVNAIKPVISGFCDDSDNDSVKILQVLDQDINQENLNKISPWRFKSPISPNLAAQKENKEINFLEVVNFCRGKISESKKLDQFLFIESAGGIMTPITDDKTFLDLITELQIPVLLLSANYLGSISHTLCATEVLKSKNIVPEFILINDYPRNVDSTNISQVIETIENLSKIKTMSLDILLD